MDINKKEVVDLIESLGNEPKQSNSVQNPLNWLQQNNPLNQSTGEPIKSKPGCKSGKCGTGPKTIAAIVAIILVIMLAGHGLFSLVENLFK